MIDGTRSSGVPVAVLEKHADFNRDFRGDTIHPSTLELMHELGLLDELLMQPHQEVRELRGVINGQTVPIADFTQLPTRCKFIAFMLVRSSIRTEPPEQA